MLRVGLSLAYMLDGLHNRRGKKNKKNIIFSNKNQVKSRFSHFILYNVPKNIFYTHDKNTTVFLFAIRAVLVVWRLNKNNLLRYYIYVGWFWMCTMRRFCYFYF